MKKDCVHCDVHASVKEKIYNWDCVCSMRYELGPINNLKTLQIFGVLISLNWVNYIALSMKCVVKMKKRLTGCAVY